MIKIRKFNESLSKVVFHNTYIERLYNILLSNTFYLTSNLGTDSDKLQKGFYYFSVSRIKFGGYAHSMGESDHVNIVLDGDKFNQRYKGGPVDYWGREMRTGKDMPFEYQMRNDENEERIFSDDSEIPDVMSYILEVHISMSDFKNKMWEHPSNREFTNIMKICANNKIPYFIYTDFSAYKLLDKRKALEGYKASVNYITALIDIYKMDSNNIEDISYDEFPYDRIRTAISYGGGMASKDTITQIKNDIHNYRTDPIYRPKIAELTKIMKKEKITSIEELMKIIANKFGVNDD